MAWFSMFRSPAETRRAPAPYFESSEWRPVILLGCGIHPGFDFDRTYEFGRDEWDKTSVFKMRDQADWFNIAGLYWRELSA